MVGRGGRSATPGVTVLGGAPARATNGEGKRARREWRMERSKDLFPQQVSSKIFDFIDPVNRVRKGELGKIGGTFSPTQVSRQVRLWRRQAPLTSMGKKNSPPFFVGLTIRNPISKS